MLDTNPQKVYAPKDLLAIAFQHQPYFAPGKGYHYSNTNTVLLGLIIEQLTGKPVEQEFQARIINPLGMTETRLQPLARRPFPIRIRRGTCSVRMSRARSALR